MHRALEIVDIVEEIVRHVPPHDLPRIMRTCRAFYYPALDLLWQLRESLDALASLLPGGLVVSGPLPDLYVFSNISNQTLFPQTAILPHLRRIRGVSLDEEDLTGVPVPRGLFNTVIRCFHGAYLQCAACGNNTSNTADAEVANTGSIADGDSDAGIEDYAGAGIADFVPPMATMAHQIILPAAPDPEQLPPDQHVMIFERAPSEDDLSQMLRKTSRCSRLRYCLQDYKGYLVFHALRQIFPSIDFFPILEEIVIAVPSRSCQVYFPLDSHGLYVPFDFMPRISSLVIEDSNVQNEGPYRSIVQGVAHEVLDALLSLPLDSVREIVYSTRPVSHDVYGERASDRDTVSDAAELVETTDLTASEVTSEVASGSLEYPTVQTLAADLHFGLFAMGPPRLPAITGPYVAIPRRFYDFIGHLGTSLRSLKLPAVPPSRFWEVLSSQMLVLDELELGQSAKGALIYRTDLTNWPDPVGNGIVDISCLKRFTCRAHAIGRDLFQVFVSYRFLALDTLVFEAPKNEPDAKYIFSILGHNIHDHAPLLRHLSIDLGYSYIRPHHPLRHRREFITLDTLAGLQNVPALEYLHIICPPSQRLSIKLANGDVMRMANTWPGIKHLFLDPAHSPDSTVTLEGLIPLAKHCSHLNELGIGLNVNITHIVYTSAMYVHEFSTEAGSTARGQETQKECPMTTLDLGTPRVHDTAACAEFLRCIFPSLDEVYPPGEEEHPGTAFAWSKVARLVKELGSIGAGGAAETYSDVSDESDEDYYWDSEECGETYDGE